ncbi:MAG: carboxyl-terminal processing protease, partial [Frankiaceae bacterium]|nr:carboxyl-terminal processing protease [Frankiaceae bacterium]
MPRYLDPAGLARIQQADDSRYAGIGIHARLLDGAVVVDRVSPGSPADVAGLRPDDRVLFADGTPVGGSDLEVALTPVRGPIDTVAHLTLQRGTTHFSAAIRRAEVAAQLVQHDLRVVRGTPIGYVQVLDFGAGVGEQVRQAVRDFDARGVREVVLDLRQNGGGLVREAVALASTFVPVGTPVLTESGQHF